MPHPANLNYCRVPIHKHTRRIASVFSSGTLDPWRIKRAVTIDTTDTTANTGAREYVAGATALPYRRVFILTSGGDCDDKYFAPMKKLPAGCSGAAKKFTMDARKNGKNYSNLFCKLP